MLKERRIMKQLTELKLATKVGISESYINKLENHPQSCNPTVNLILRLSKELSLNPIKTFMFFIKDKVKDQDN